MDEQIEKIVAVIRKILLKDRDFYGNIKLNFYKGKLVNVNIETCVKIQEEKA